MKTGKKVFSQERLRQIAWEIGQNYPASSTADYVALSMVHPRLGHVCWHVRKGSANSVLGPGKGIPAAVVRIYDVTDILFDGYNAHSFFDLEVGALSGNYYFGIDRPARNYLAEAGFRMRDGSFHPAARSDAAYFDSSRPTGNYQIAGLFVGGAIERVFPVESMFDAPVFEAMDRQLAIRKDRKAISVGVVFLGVNHAAAFNGPLGAYIKGFSERFLDFGGHAAFFAPQVKEAQGIADASLLEATEALSRKIYKRLKSAHKKKPLELVHCHDWYSSAVGIPAKKELGLPMVLSLHSTEQERAREETLSALSLKISSRERKAVQEAALVIVPHSSTRQQVIDHYAAPPEKVIVIRDVLGEKPSQTRPGPHEIKRWFQLNHDAPVVLFAGEMSHAAGADLLLEALPTVCRNHASAQFVFAGDGPLKGELEARARREGIDHRCRFPGDLPSQTFEALLVASDLVVIPARVWQDQGLARMAIGYGKPVLATHQAGITCVAHGENGLVTFDNPGSIVWGIQELLFNPPQSMLRLAVKKEAGASLSRARIAAEHYLRYAMVLEALGGADHA